jgi:hypothetical protein
MSTRATIKFQDKWDTYYVYRHCDGFPENILPDIKDTIKSCNGRWSCSELGQLVSCFLGKNYNDKSRIQDYEITPCFHGDESYKYYVKWIDDKGIYECGVYGR